MGGLLLAGPRVVAELGALHADLRAGGQAGGQTGLPTVASMHGRSIMLVEPAVRIRQGSVGLNLLGIGGREKGRI
jgi:hypothetical protein